MRAMKFIAWELVYHADIYREALLREARMKREESLKNERMNLHFFNRIFVVVLSIHSIEKSFHGKEKDTERIDKDLYHILSTQKSLYVHPSFRNYTYAFKPDQMSCSYKSVSSVKKMMLLFGTSQIEA